MDQDAVATNGIETLFPSDDEEKDLRVYGAVRETATSAPKVRPALKDEDDEHGGNKSTSHLLPSQRHGSQGSLNSAGTHVSTRSYSENVSLIGPLTVELAALEHLKYPYRCTMYLSWYHHPKVRENWKVVVGAFMLTIIGLILFLAGVGILISPSRGMQCLVFFIGGLLCLIPGAYHLVYIYLAVRGIEGYSLYNLPVFS